MQRPLGVGFGGVESDTDYCWMHTRPYYHLISTFNIYYKSVVVPHMYAETPQCSTADSAAPNLQNTCWAVHTRADGTTSFSNTI